MQIHELFPIFGHFAEQLVIFGKRNSWEIYLQELGVVCAVGIGIEHCVDIIENLLRCRFPLVSPRLEFR